MPEILNQPHDDFSTLFEFLPIGAYRSSPDGRQLRANPALVALNGYATEAEQIAGVHDIATEWYVDPLRRAQFAQSLERDGFVRGFVSEVYRHKTRERIWISENAHSVRAPDGSVLYFEGTVEDISERMRDEAALRESKVRLQRALDATGDGVWEVDLQAGTETFSPQFLALFGFDVDEVPADPSFFDRRTHPEDVAQMLRDREAHFAGRAPRYVNEHRVQCKDGRWKWVLSRGLVIERDREGLPLRMIGTHTDITRAKEAEALRRARDQAESADRAKTELLSRVSHELRTPMNGVLGFAQLLDKARDLPPQYRPWVAQILASGKHLAGVVDDLLDLSSAQSGGMALALAPVDAALVVQDSWAMVEARARDAGVAFVPQFDGLQRADVLADRRRLTQVFTNLLSNAVKYNRSGGLVEVLGRRRGDTIEIDVVDSGLGMTAEQLTRIFQPFQRLGAEASGVEGTGLGLALSQQLVVAMGGEIRVTSRPGIGTTFSVALRAAS